MLPAFFAAASDKEAAAIPLASAVAAALILKEAFFLGFTGLEGCVKQVVGISIVCSFVCYA